MHNPKWLNGKFWHRAAHSRTPATGMAELHDFNPKVAVPDTPALMQEPSAGTALMR
jgi:hypothetical protein